MRKTTYDSYVEVYMTTEERCALWRFMTQIDTCVIGGTHIGFTDIEKMHSVSCEDISVLHDLVNFVYTNSPGKACKSISVDAGVRKAQRIKRIP